MYHTKFYCDSDPASALNPLPSVIYKMKIPSTGCLHIRRI